MTQVTEGTEPTRRPILEALAVGLGLLLVGVFAGHPLSSIDSFWHLKLGEVIAREGRIPDTDMFSSVHPGRPWVQFQWLWEWLYFHIYELGGYRLLRASQSLLMVATFGSLYGLLRRRSTPLYAWLVTTVAVALYVDRFRLRPDAWNLLLLACALPVLLGGYRQVRPRTLLGLGALACFWSNLHGGASVLLLACVGAVAVGDLLARLLHLGVYSEASGARSGLSPLWLIPVTAAGLLASPTFVPGWLHFAAIYGPMQQAGNVEWAPTYTMLRHGQHPLMFAIAFGPSAVAFFYGLEQLGALRARGRGAVEPAEWLLCAGCIFLSHHALRNAVLAVVPLAFMLGRLAQVRLAPIRAWVLGAGTGVLWVLIVHYSTISAYGGLSEMAQLSRHDLTPGAYPVEVTDFMREAGIEGPTLNYGRWAGFLIWRTFPACRVFFDTRRNIDGEMWQVVRKSNDALDRLPAFEHAFMRWGIDLVVFRGPTFPLEVAPPTWQLLFQAGDQEIYQRRGGLREGHNVRAAIAFLNERGAALPEDPSAQELANAARRVGGEIWLSAPFQQRRLRQLTARIQRAPSADALRARGSLLHRAGRYPEALADLAQAVTMQPRSAVLHYRHALAAFMAGDHVQARVALGRLSALPSQTLSRVQRGRAQRLSQALLR